MKVLGISAYYHDSAAALVVDGRIVAAAQEERFTRRKHDLGFPENAVRYCLTAAGVAPGEIDLVAYYEKPFLKFERLLETYLAFAPKGFRSFRTAIPVWLKEKLFQRDCSPDSWRRSIPMSIGASGWFSPSTTRVTPPRPSIPRPSKRRPS